MIHSCTFRTEMLRQNGLEMPKHTFYEDNYMVYGNLKGVTRMYYMNADLYRYFIGREGQSVQEDVMKRRYTHQLTATELCFRAIRLDEVREKRKLSYLKHELFIMFGISRPAQPDPGGGRQSGGHVGPVPGLRRQVDRLLPLSHAAALRVRPRQGRLGLRGVHLPLRPPGGEV